MQQLLFANPGLIFSDIRCCHRKARGPDAGKHQQVEGSRPGEEPRKAFWGGRELHRNLGSQKATRLLAVGTGEIDDVANKLGVSAGDSGLSFKVLLVFQLSQQNTSQEMSWWRQQQQSPNFLFSRKFWMKYVTGMKTNEKLYKSLSQSISCQTGSRQISYQNRLSMTLRWDLKFTVALYRRPGTEGLLCLDVGFPSECCKYHSLIN